MLKTHSRVHTGLYIIFLSNIVVLLTHLKISLIAGEKPFKCNVCDRAFAHKSTLNEHLNLHSDDKPYECPTCLRLFSSSKLIDFSDSSFNLYCHSGNAGNSSNEKVYVHIIVMTHKKRM